MLRFLIPLMLFSSLLVSGCSWLGGDDEDKLETEGYTEQDFYSVIQRKLNSKQWEAAISNLEALEAQFPFGDYAEQAQLELIYAHHKSSDQQAAIAAADRFIKLHPQHPNVDYAIYMKGLSAYAESQGLVSNFLPVDATLRDPGSARDSFAAFNELLTRFPDSPYAGDSRQRIIYLRNVLARHEIHVANYYFKRGAYLAAVNRGRYVVENFQQTTAVPDGLAVMAQGYYLLGMNNLADDSARLLAINYPEHPALDSEGNFAFQEDVSDLKKSWLNTLSFGLLRGDFKDSPSYDTRSIYDPIDTDSDDASVGQKRSIWSRITFGLFD